MDFSCGISSLISIIIIAVFLVIYVSVNTLGLLLLAILKLPGK